MADDRDARIAQLGAELRHAREEIGSRDRALDAAREQQAASTAILRTIASSSSNLQQVLHALVTSLCQLVGADSGAAARLDGDEIVLVASTNPEAVGRRQPIAGTVTGRAQGWGHVAEMAGTRQPIAGTVTGRALTEARTIHVFGSKEEQLAQYPSSGAARKGAAGAGDHAADARRSAYRHPGGQSA